MADARSIERLLPWLLQRRPIWAAGICGQPVASHGIGGVPAATADGVVAADAASSQQPVSSPNIGQQLIFCPDLLEIFPEDVSQTDGRRNTGQKVAAC
jgi:hypothetical protein